MCSKTTPMKPAISEMLGAISKSEETNNMIRKANERTQSSDGSKDKYDPPVFDYEWNEALAQGLVSAAVGKQKSNNETVVGQKNANNEAMNLDSSLPVAKQVDEYLISVDDAKSARDKMAETKEDMITKLENMNDKKFKKKLNDPKFKARVKGILNNFGKNMGNIQKRETLIQTMKNI